jgi:hypothetical protein
LDSNTRDLIVGLNLLGYVHVYVDQQRPDCLLIATADVNTITKEIFFTGSSYPQAKFNSIKIEEIILIRLFEIIFSLKDLLSNNDNDAVGFINLKNLLLLIQLMYRSIISFALIHLYI